MGGIKEETGKSGVILYFRDNADCTCCISLASVFVIEFLFYNSFNFKDWLL
jgi:hypothetical protein